MTNPSEESAVCFHAAASLEQCVVFAKTPHRIVCEYDENKSDNGLINACRGGHAYVARTHETFEDVRIDRLRRLEQSPGGHRHLIEQAEVGAEDAAHRQDRENDDDRLDHRQRDPHRLLPLRRAVDHGGFVIFGIDAGYGRDIDDRPDADAFPGVHEGQNVRPVRLVAVPEDRIRAEQGENRGVHEPLRRMQERIDEVADDDHRQKIRQDDEALIRLGQQPSAQFVDRDRDDDGQRRVHDHERQAV